MSWDDYDRAAEAVERDPRTPCRRGVCLHHPMDPECCRPDDDDDEPEADEPGEGNMIETDTHVVAEGGLRQLLSDAQAELEATRRELREARRRLARVDPMIPTLRIVLSSAERLVRDLAVHRKGGLPLSTHRSPEEIDLSQGIPAARRHLRAVTEVDCV